MVSHEFSIHASRHRMRKGELKAEALADSCLKRIHANEDSVHAWVDVYEKEALRSARRCDDAYQDGKWQGDLHGIPIGVKDIIDVKGMWTRYGSSVRVPAGLGGGCRDTFHPRLQGGVDSLAPRRP